MHRFLLPAIAAVALAGCSTKASQSDLAQIYIGSPQVTEWHEGVLVQAIESKTTSDVVDLAGQALPTHGVLGGVGAVINAASLVSSGAVYSYQFHLKKPDGNVEVLPPIEYTKKMNFIVGDTYRVFYADSLKIKWPANLTKYPELTARTAAREIKTGAPTQP